MIMATGSVKLVLIGVMEQKEENAVTILPVYSMTIKTTRQLHYFRGQGLTVGAVNGEGNV